MKRFCWANLAQSATVGALAAVLTTVLSLAAAIEPTWWIAFLSLASGSASAMIASELWWPLWRSVIDAAPERPAAIHDETGSGGLIFNRTIHLPEPRKPTDDELYETILTFRIQNHDSFTSFQIGKIASSYARTHGLDPSWDIKGDWSKAKVDGTVRLMKMRPSKEIDVLHKRLQREADVAILNLVRAETITTGEQP